MEANILRILVVLLGVAVVAVVLIQQPKEGGMGAFTGGGGGSGASSTVFGSKGSGSFLFRLTAALTLIFAVMVVLLVKITNSNLGGSVLSAPAIEAEAIPGDVNTTSSESIPGAGGQASSAVPAPANTANTGDATTSDAIPGAAEAATETTTTDSVPAPANTANTGDATTSDAIPGAAEATTEPTTTDSVPAPAPGDDDAPPQQ